SADAARGAAFVPVVGAVHAERLLVLGFDRDPNLEHLREVGACTIAGLFAALRLPPPDQVPRRRILARRSAHPVGRYGGGCATGETYGEHDRETFHGVLPFYGFAAVTCRDTYVLRPASIATSCRSKPPRPTPPLPRSSTRTS